MVQKEKRGGEIYIVTIVKQCNEAKTRASCRARLFQAARKSYAHFWSRFSTSSSIEIIQIPHRRNGRGRLSLVTLW